MGPSTLVNPTEILGTFANSEFRIGLLPFVGKEGWDDCKRAARIGYATGDEGFISYSRKDMAFADRLEAALKVRKFEPVIDREDIYAFEDWWKRIQSLIGRADTVVFVLSPDAVKSEVALKEGKRFSAPTL